MSVRRRRRGCGKKSHPTSDAGSDAGDASAPNDASDAANDAPSATNDADASLEAAPPTPDAGDADASDGSDATDASDAADAPPALATATPCTGVVTTGNVLLDLGHAAPVVLLRQSGSRVLSQDATGHWALFDADAHTIIANGDAAECPDDADPRGCITATSPYVAGGFYPVDMAGDIVLVRTAMEIDLLAASDGHALHAIAAADPGFVGLANDGSYVWMANRDGLTAWSTTGPRLLKRTGDYGQAMMAATPGELRVGGGPTVGDDNVVELISTATGASKHTPALPSTFEAWFLDGEHFLTAERTESTTTISVFSKDGSAAGTLDLSSDVYPVTGQGQFLWAHENPSNPSSPFGGTLKIYKLGGGDTPVWTAKKPNTGGIVVGDANLLGVASDPTAPMTLLDLSGDTIKEIATHVMTPNVFAADATGHWSAGDYTGVVTGGGTAATPLAARALDCGAVGTMAGADSGRVAISTAVGQILTIDLPSNRALHAAFARAGGTMQMSADGTILATFAGQTLSLLDLQHQTLVDAWTYPPSTDGTPGSSPQLVGYSLARSGTRLGRLTSTSMGTRNTGTLTFQRLVTDLLGGATSYSDAYSTPFTLQNNAPAPIALSPSGQLVAVSDASRQPDSAMALTAQTKIFDGMTALGTIDGYPIGWLDEEHLLVWHFERDTPTGPNVYGGTVVCDKQGHVVTTLPLSSSARTGSLTPSRLYDPTMNQIVSTTTGQVVWTGPTRTLSFPSPVGAMAGSSVVYTLGHEVRVEAF
ncbi:MAG TPA: hypothetical protein VHJ20_14430 [Polyangia bacterium]|nr:hypothetical protein [Polyangia bacterium]